MKRPSLSLIGGGILILIALFGVGHEIRNAVRTYHDYKDGAARQQTVMEQLRALEQPVDFDIVLALASASPSTSRSEVAPTPTPDARPLTDLGAEKLAKLREMTARYNALPVETQSKFLRALPAWSALTPFQRAERRLDDLKTHTR